MCDIQPRTYSATNRFQLISNRQEVEAAVACADTK